jgi:co-chaperonin GroES (HSP10)
MPGQMTLGYGQILIRPIRPSETTEAGVIVADAKTRQFLCSHVVDVGIGMAQDLIGKRILHSARVGRAYQLNGVEYFIIWGVHTPPGAATLSDATIGGDIIAILEEDVQVEY